MVVANDCDRGGVLRGGEAVYGGATLINEAAAGRVLFTPGDCNERW
ncbi:MAG TPA: hypothetical protein VFQ61_31825 [Polyangiaceae bacterium]|nr:hypothetical protein [Polyangiaceae bacterium]